MHLILIKAHLLTLKSRYFFLELFYNCREATRVNYYTHLLNRGGRLHTE